MNMPLQNSPSAKDPGHGPDASQAKVAVSFEDARKDRAKSKNLKPLAGLLPFLMAYRGKVIMALLALLLAAGAMLAIPLAVRRVMDHGFGNANAVFVNQYFGMMLVVAGMLALGSAARYYYVTWVGERVVADLRAAVFNHLTGLSLSFFETARSGEILSRLTADTTQIKSVFGATASVALRNLVMLTGSIIMMVVTSPKLSGLVLLAIPLMVLPLVLFGRKVRALSRLSQDTLADSAALAQETLSAVQAVQANGQENRIREMFTDATNKAFNAIQTRTRARAFLTASIIFIAFASIIAILWYGAKDMMAGNMTGGALGQFVLYAVFAAGALGSLSEVWGEVQLAAGAAERLTELLETRSAIAAPAKPVELPEPPTGALAFKDVVFAYPARPGEVALDHASFSAAAGETVAIVGPSGAGKSTIFNLIMRFYDPGQGAITLDNVNVRDVDPVKLRAQMALVPQEPVIFSTSILENIRFGRPDASDEQVRTAALAARVDEFADRLPEGMDTRAGERGVTLSGGQRQRIAIARALLRDAPVLLLDEATSALDAESEQFVQAALGELMKDRTTLVIAHRLSTVRGASRIIVLDQGKIVAQGNHAALMKKGGLYARLAKLQFDGGS